nr:protein ripply1 isoform X2 [Loxodonta africana]
MDPATPVAAASAPALALAKAPAQDPLAFPGLLSPLPLLLSGQEVHRSERLFWPKSRSFDYLYSDGEILLQNFPVQATINLYEDSDSEDEKEEEEEEDEEEEEKEKAEECVRVLASVPRRATAHPLSSPPTCLN